MRITDACENFRTVQIGIVLYLQLSLCKNTNADIKLNLVNDPTNDMLATGSINKIYR